jgi:hypothetical protein
MMLILATGLGIWFSIRGGQPTSPVYGNPSSRPDQAWAWDGTDYQLLSLGTGPASNAADLTYDAGREELVAWDHGCTQLVMGFTGGCRDQANQTWTARAGAGWTLRHPKSEPVAVGLGVLVYAKSLGGVIYLNGVGAAWAWNGEEWHQLAIKNRPQIDPPGSARSQAQTFVAGYDEESGLLYLVQSARTWTTNGSAWSRVAVNSGIDSGQARADARLVYDRALHRLVYVGRDNTFTWEGSRWAASAQPSFGASSAAYDPLTRLLVLVDQAAGPCDGSSCRALTWTWNGTWTQVAVAHPPLLPRTRTGSASAPLAFDEARGQLVLLVNAA